MNLTAIFREAPCERPSGLGTIGRHRAVRSSAQNMTSVPTMSAEQNALQDSKTILRFKGLMVNHRAFFDEEEVREAPPILACRSSAHAGEDVHAPRGEARHD